MPRLRRRRAIIKQWLAIWWWRLVWRVRMLRHYLRYWWGRLTGR